MAIIVRISAVATISIQHKDARVIPILMRTAMMRLLHKRASADDVYNK